MDTIYRQANWTEQLPNSKVKCLLCPRYCQIGKGQSGFCFIRKNISGKLYSLGYGRPSSIAVDPIEKKPLYHFYPNSEILSFGTAGCNLGCKHCQNWTLSKSETIEINAPYILPKSIISLAKENHTHMLAYTYNEPTIFAEYVIDTAKLAHEANLKNVIVSNGYFSKESRKDFLENIDAANIDIKGFTEEFYRKITSSSLKPVLDNLVWLKDNTAIWLELTNLIIPEYNDNMSEIKKMCRWIVQNLGERTPLHFTAFYPNYKLTSHYSTSYETLSQARQIAINEGMKYVYTGNILDNSSQSTYCTNCNKCVIMRSHHSVIQNSLKKGNCPFCSQQIDGCF